jgi:radical SAM superfamily enzyme YgiQ (UPF0313 family)
MKITLIEPASPASHVYSRFRLPRLGVLILGQLAAKAGHEVSVCLQEQKRSVEEAIRRADLVGVSTVTSTAPAAFRLIDLARNWGAKTVLGGAHPTALPEESLRHADFVLRGEGEESFLQLLEHLQGGRSCQEVAGLSWLEGGVVRHNPLPLPTDPARIPAIDFFKLLGEPMGRKTHGVLPLQTARGCPHNCNFCSVTSMFGRKLRFLSPEQVAEQLELLRGQGDLVFFYDDNFCASPTRTKKLLDYLLTHNVFLPPWTAQVSVRAARDEEMLRLMARSGCKTVYVGFESFNESVLAGYHKQQSAEDIRRTVESFHRHGIRVHGMFMAGADQDDARSIRRTAPMARRLGIDTIQMMVLTPLPGTPVFDEMRRAERLLSYDWSLYDGHHAVFFHSGMKPRQMEQAAVKAMKKFYSRGLVVSSLLKLDFYRTKFAVYARHQLKLWWRENRRFLRDSAASPASGPLAHNLA